MNAKTQQIEPSSTDRFIALGEMRVSDRAQRKLNKNRVAKLLAKFNLDLLGLPVVNARDGQYWIIDGQHRIEALKQFLGEGWESVVIECRAYDGMSEVDEADMFDRLNDILPVASFDRFRTRVEAHRPEELEVYRVIESQGLKISMDAVPGAIRAVSTVTNAWKRVGSKNLATALRIIREAYGDAGFEAIVINGMSRFVQRYSSFLDEAVVIERLAEAHGGVKGLIGKAEVLHRQTGVPKAECLGAAVVEVNNAGKGGHRLSSWWKEEAGPLERKERADELTPEIARKLLEDERPATQVALDTGYSPSVIRRLRRGEHPLQRAGEL